jgi:hypothetical protein
MSEIVRYRRLIPNWSAHTSEQPGPIVFDLKQYDGEEVNSYPQFENKVRENLPAGARVSSLV